MGRQLVNTNVEFISLVKKGANGEKVTIFKSDTTPEATATEPAVVPENVAPAADPEVKTEEDQVGIKKFFEVMKNFFGGQKTEVEVAKSKDLPYVSDYTSFTARVTNERSKVRDAMYILEDVIYSIFWDDTIDNGKELILKNVDEFKAYLSDMFSQTVEVQKEAFAKEEPEMKPEDIKALLAETLAPVTKSIEDLTTKVTALEKTEEPAKEEPKTEGAAAPETEVAKSAEPAKEEPKVEDVVKSAMQELLAPIAKSIEGLTERVETVENVRGISKQSDAKEIKKSADDWAGVLPFIGQ